MKIRSNSSFYNFLQIHQFPEHVAVNGGLMTDKQTSIHQPIVQAAFPSGILISSSALPSFASMNGLKRKDSSHKAQAMSEKRANMTMKRILMLFYLLFEKIKFQEVFVLRFDFLLVDLTVFTLLFIHLMLIDVSNKEMLTW